MYAQLEHVS